MIDFNIYFWVIIGFLIGFKILDTWVEKLNLENLKGVVPEFFADVIDADTYKNLVDYTRVNTRFDWISRWLRFAILLIFWLVGGFVWLQGLVDGFGWPEVWTGCLFFGVLFFLQSLIDLPFDWVETFRIEERFGFNRTDVKTFILDRVKGTGLALVLGGPILAMILWFFGSAGTWGWLWGWLAFSAISFALSYVAPHWLLPLFHKFEPLKEGPLRSSIEELAEKESFPLTDISVMDGSRRSTKSNAFFTGFGKRKRIALFDTLMEHHDDREVLAVLAHEIGHFRCGHIKKMLVLSFLQTGFLFFLAGWFIRSEGLHAAFGLQEVHVYTGLVFFSLLFTPISRVLSLGLLHLSRRHEFEADAFARRAVGEGDSLARALKKLTRDNLVVLRPHPWYVLLNDSHPPMIERLEALGRADS